MTSNDAAPTLLGPRLSVMMFFQFAIWGAWLPLLWPFLHEHRGFTPGEIGNMFAIGAVGALVAPFIAGQIADRYFSTERFLAISHLVGGLLVFQLAWIESYGAFLVFSLLYSLIYSPTLPLTNSLSFHHLTDRDTQFGKIRVWGTVGWIVVGIAIGQWLFLSHTISDQEAVLTLVQTELVDNEARAGLAEEAPLYASLAAEGKAPEIANAIRMLETEGSSEVAVAERLHAEAAFSDDAVSRAIHLGQVAGMADAFRLSGILGVLMGIYCFTLPHTPPSKGKQRNAAMEALGEVRRNPLLTLFLIAVPISCIHQFYFVHTAGFLGSFQSETATAINRIFGVGGGGLMTVGQMSEILVLAAMPFVAKRVSRKMLLITGVAAYALRMFLFGYVDSIAATTGLHEVAILIPGIALHGLCFGCFIFVAFMIVDEETTGDVRASAQSLFNLVIVGIGIIVGSKIATGVAEWATDEATEVMDFRALFNVPMWAAVACFVLMLVFYPGGRRAAKPVSDTTDTDS